jgi:hypothetical protein
MFSRVRHKKGIQCVIHTLRKEKDIQLFLNKKSKEIKEVLTHILQQALVNMARPEESEEEDMKNERTYILLINKTEQYDERDLTLGWSTLPPKIQMLYSKVLVVRTSDFLTIQMEAFDRNHPYETEGTEGTTDKYIVSSVLIATSTFMHSHKLLSQIKICPELRWIENTNKRR